MVSTISRIPPNREMEVSEVFEKIGYFRSPFTNNRYNRVTAIAVNKAYDEALVECHVRCKPVEWLVGKKFPCIPREDLVWLNQTINRANAAELAMLRSAVLSAIPMAKDARLSVYAEAA